MPPGTRGAILKSGAQYWGTQGLDFLTTLAPGAGPTKQCILEADSRNQNQIQGQPTPFCF